jgi:hypothetical protein
MTTVRGVMSTASHQGVHTPQWGTKVPVADPVGNVHGGGEGNEIAALGGLQTCGEGTVDTSPTNSQQKASDLGRFLASIMYVD